MTTTKKIIIPVLATIVTAAATAGTIWFIRKKKKNDITTSEDCQNDFNENNSDSTEEIEVPEDETTTVIDDKDTIYQYIAYLTKNGVDANEVICICETIDIIRVELPEYYMTVKEAMKSMMESEFDITKSQEFDNKNYKFLYSNIDICKMFLKNGLAILAMGMDCQEDMMKLSEELTDFQQLNSDEILEDIDVIYHEFNRLPNIEEINETTYVEKFKKFVDKYVVKTNNSGKSEESGDVE